MSQMAEGASRVLALLDYIEQVEKLKVRPAFSVPSEYFVAYQHELMELPELRLNVQADGDDVWMRIPRLIEIAPPELDEVLKPWVRLSRSPDKGPELLAECVSCERKLEVGQEKLTDHPEVKEYFDWYVEFLWEPWAVAERSRRKTITRYNQLFALQQAIASEGVETPIELVWGIGCAGWKNPSYGAASVRHPILVQACEVVLNEKTFDLEVRPRDVEPRLEIDCYAEMEIAGVGALEAHWRNALATGASRVNPFEPSTFDGVLKAAVGHLDPSGHYEARTDDFSPPRVAEHLAITNTWVIFGRKRSGDIFLEDIRRLKKKVEGAQEIPAVIRSLVEEGDSTVRVQPEQAFRGLSTSEAGNQALELYFPMPYNDEQVSIVQKLHSNDGVVVQGPPGTGKTHTIANVICHYLAQGKRVLVTAKGESALAVLQEKLPEAIRPLSVSLLSDERDGMKQFEHSIQSIATMVSSLNPVRSEANIVTADEKLNHLHAKIANVDRSIAAHAKEHMQMYSFQGREITPEDLAKRVMQDAPAHDWFDDEPSVEAAALAFDDIAVSAMRRARMMVAGDLMYLGCTVPPRTDFPAWVDLAPLHRDLVREKSIEASVVGGGLYALVDSTMSTFERAQALLTFLQDRFALKTRLAGVQQAWTAAVGRRLRDLPATDPMAQALAAACQDVHKLEHERRELVAKAVEVPVDAEVVADFMEAIERLVAGKSAFALPFGKGQARKAIAAVTVAGMPPRTAESWSDVNSVLLWRLDARKAIARWNALATEFGFDQASGANVETKLKGMALTQEILDGLRRLTFVYDAGLHSRFKEVFGGEVADKMWDGGEPFVASIYSSLQAHVDRGRLGYAMKRVQELLHKLSASNGPIVEAMRNFLTESLGNAAMDEGDLLARWESMRHELERLARLQPALAEILDVTEAIEKAGASNWAKRLRTIPATADFDAITPTSWVDAWYWRCAVKFLDRIDGHHKIRDLFGERRELTTTLARTYEDLVAEKTWLGVFKNSPPMVRQALQAYLNAVQAMGTGRGVRAVRHRRTARDAMIKAYQAVPCWVLPQWRVSETLPPEVGLFDLVVIDEASQSDIWALPSLLRGKKMLVVGDNKQVSPSAVGMAEEKIKDLVARFLSKDKQPHGSEMTPDKSIYDLARVVFAGNSVMLREHFRCVPAIIEFSNREFYENEIKALRIPKSNERLDPPLVDVRVKGGHRNGDVNEPEAKAVVDEIESVLADPQLAGRSIGVVTLLGTAQAARIHELVSQRISPVDIVARRIAIGPPPVFQGRERDIMLVSMVLGPDDRAAATRADMEQRFNVALSRARDRMYLFRSVDDGAFPEKSLNGKLIRHFKQPFQHDIRRVDALRERCESGFEREVFDQLVKWGFRVEPQVRCGSYRIDLVVEGGEGRRLAIECDGDAFHGPGKWQDDMARQRVLERAGWTFWRCFASSWVRRQDAIKADLKETLDHLGIEALGAESVDSTAWVIYKEVDPFSLEENATEVTA